MKTFYFSKGQDFEEDIDGLVAISEWFVERRGIFKTDEFSEFVDRLGAATTKEVEDRFGENDAGLWGTMLDGVERMQELLEHDFSQELEWINEELRNSYDRDGPDEDDGRRITKTSSLSSIDSIFESLLE